MVDYAYALIWSNLTHCVFQFNSFMMVIRDMLSRMETEHKTKLEQLHVMQEQQRYVCGSDAPCAVDSVFAY